MAEERAERSSWNDRVFGPTPLPPMTTACPEPVDALRAG